MMRLHHAYKHDMMILCFLFVLILPACLIFQIFSDNMSNEKPSELQAEERVEGSGSAPCTSQRLF